jgi:hypothetical protein
MTKLITAVAILVVFLPWAMLAHSQVTQAALEDQENTHPGSANVSLDDENCQKKAPGAPLDLQDPTIDFEDLAGPNVFTKADSISCLNGDVTFSGGQILTGETLLFADLTKVLGTSFYCDNCASTITVKFAKKVRRYSVKILNGETQRSRLTITDDNGSANVNLAEIFKNGSTTYEDDIGNVTFIKISSQSASWNFSIDNLAITFQ